MAAPISQMLFSLLRSYSKSFRALSVKTHCARYCTNSLSNVNNIAQSNGGKANGQLAIFFNEEVQRLLYKITGFDISKLCAPMKVHSKKPHYELLTDEQLHKAQKEALERATKRLQMPPAMGVREVGDHVMSIDPDLEGLMDSKLVCVDITYGIHDKKRHIVVRGPDGTLRHGTGEERDRINQIYNPKPNRSIFVPRIFETENLERVLDKGWYAYVLDWTCAQFEPDHQDYLRVSHRTFEHISENKMFDDLRSTRHFGPMAFYFAWHKTMEPLLMDMIQCNLLSDGIDLIRVYSIIHPNSETCQKIQDVEDSLQIIKIFCEAEASHSYKGQLQLTIQAFEDAQKSHAEMSV